MEYIQHGDLAQYIGQYGAKAKTEVKQITSQVLEGLVVLHEKEFCHRDLKPQVQHQPKTQQYILCLRITLTVL